MQSLTNRRQSWTLVAVSLAVFMTAVDNTVVNLALPSIRSDLGLGQSSLEWIVNGYVLAFATLLLTGGRLGDLFGRRRAFLAGLAVFTGASLLAGLAGSEALLVGARVLQGAGAALLVPPPWRSSPTPSPSTSAAARSGSGLPSARSASRSGP